MNVDLQPNNILFALIFVPIELIIRLAFYIFLNKIYCIYFGRWWEILQTFISVKKSQRDGCTITHTITKFETHALNI